MEEYYVLKPFPLNNKTYKMGEKILLSERQAVFQESKGRISKDAPAVSKPQSKTKSEETE